MKTILIEIHLKEPITMLNLESRYSLVAMIESKQRGSVIEETSSSNMMEVVLEVENDVDILDELHSMLAALDIDNYLIKEINKV